MRASSFKGYSHYNITLAEVNKNIDIIVDCILVPFMIVQLVLNFHKMELWESPLALVFLMLFIIGGYQNIQWVILKKQDGKFYDRNLFKWREIHPENMIITKHQKAYDVVKHQDRGLFLRYSLYVTLPNFDKEQLKLYQEFRDKIPQKGARGAT